MAYYRWRDSTAKKPQIQIRPPPPPQPPIPGAPGQPPLDKAREIMKYGFPGPVSDLLYRQAYVSSYNRSTRNPNWVAEHLTAKSLERAAALEAGKASWEVMDVDNDKPDRSKAVFREDQAIPRLFRAKLKDYIGTGFDRGHMAPAADVHESQEAVNETFLLTNIAPQVGPGFNRGYWFLFENFARSLTKEFDDVYVVTGPLYLPKQEEDGKYYVKYQVIGDPPNTSVPTHFYKVILAVKNDKPALSAFVLPNEPIGEVPLTEYETPLD
ncbi:nuclease, partial [Borealophlyctis nickersoniae]